LKKLANLRLVSRILSITVKWQKAICKYRAIGQPVHFSNHHFLFLENLTMAHWYETLFANFGKTYDKECFTQGTVGEADFVERELGGDRSKRILDIACGTGRHAIELTKRGYQVVGFDLSEGQLRLAREKAAAASVSVDFQQRDATQPHFHGEFDAALMFCEGAFPLMETDAKNFAILQHAATALRPGGKLMLTTLSALFPLFHSVKDFLAAKVSGATAEKLTFDLMTFRNRGEFTFTDDSGASHTIETNERYYTPSEMHWLLQTAGFTNVAIHGCHGGQFSREHSLTIDDFEMLVVAEK
jgi:2-polyprenyl-3-methyl-5-hydroxy-6-metoxy-1,4-benzoquinol methylase